jgi:hypothetical protein
MLLKELPTLEDLQSACNPYAVRLIQEDHGEVELTKVYDVLHFDGIDARYSDDVFDTEEEAKTFINKQEVGEVPDLWAIYTPAESQ